MTADNTLTLLVHRPVVGHCLLAASGRTRNAAAVALSPTNLSHAQIRRKGYAYAVADAAGQRTAEAAADMVVAAYYESSDEDALVAFERAVRAGAAAAQGSPSGIATPRERVRARLPQLEAGVAAVLCYRRGLVASAAPSGCAYRIRGNSIQLVNSCHGASSPLVHPLPRQTGPEAAGPPVSLMAVELRPGDRVVLGTAGLSTLVQPGEILELVCRLGPRRSAEAVADLARRRGWSDALSAVVVTAAPPDPVPGIAEWIDEERRLARSPTPEPPVVESPSKPVARRGRRDEAPPKPVHRPRRADAPSAKPAPRPPRADAPAVRPAPRPPRADAAPAKAPAGAAPTKAPAGASPAKAPAGTPPPVKASAVDPRPDPTPDDPPDVAPAPSSPASMDQGAEPPPKPQAAAKEVRREPGGAARAAAAAMAAAAAARDAVARAAAAAAPRRREAPAGEQKEGAAIGDAAKVGPPRTRAIGPLPPSPGDDGAEPGLPDAAAAPAPDDDSAAMSAAMSAAAPAEVSVAADGPDEATAEWAPAAELSTAPAESVAGTILPEGDATGPEQATDPPTKGDSAVDPLTMTLGEATDAQAWDIVIPPWERRGTVPSSPVAAAGVGARPTAPAAGAALEGGSLAVEIPWRLLVVAGGTFGALALAFALRGPVTGAALSIAADASGMVAQASDAAAAAAAGVAGAGSGTWQKLRQGWPEGKGAKAPAAAVMPVASATPSPTAPLPPPPAPPPTYTPYPTYTPAPTYTPIASPVQRAPVATVPSRSAAGITLLSPTDAETVRDCLRFSWQMDRPLNGGEGFQLLVCAGSSCTPRNGISGDGPPVVWDPADTRGNPDLFGAPGFYRWVVAVVGGGGEVARSAAQTFAWAGGACGERPAGGGGPPPRRPKPTPPPPLP